MFARAFICALVGVSTILGGERTVVADASDTSRGVLDPRGKIHIPIGVANTLDTLKTLKREFRGGLKQFMINMGVDSPEQAEEVLKVASD